MLWMKIAAGLIFLSVASVILWNNSTDTDQNNTIATKQNSSKENQAIVTAPTDVSTTSVDLMAQQKNVSPSVTPDKKQKAVVEEHHPLEVTETVQEEIQPASEILVAETLPIQTDIPQTESLSGIYLVYTAEEVNQKYLRQQPEEDATSAEKKSSRIQMLMRVANNLKNSDNGLGDLRQMKDEIFALNFIDEKKQQTKNN